MTRLEAQTLAEKHHCATSTIHRWAREGAPLNDPTALAAWLRGRRSMPSGTETLAEMTPLEMMTQQLMQAVCGIAQELGSNPTGRLPANKELLKEIAETLVLRGGFAFWLAMKDPTITQIRDVFQRDEFKAIAKVSAKK